VIRIISEVINDEEIQKKGTQYFIEILENESFINSFAQFTNHLLVKILSEERIAETFCNTLVCIISSEKFNTQIKKFIDDTVKREETRRTIMKWICFFLFRKESSDAIEQFIEYGTSEILYDADLNPNMTNLLVEIMISNLIRRKYFDNYTRHLLDDYPDEKTWQRVQEIIEQEDYLFNENFKKSRKYHQNDQINLKNNIDLFDRYYDNTYKSHKEKYDSLYKNNNYYIDGYLSKEKPKNKREKIIELGKIYKNLKYTDVVINPDLGTFTDYDTSPDPEYFKLIMDQAMNRNNIFMKIHKGEDIYLNKFINDKQLQEEFSLYKSKNQQNKNDLSHYLVNFDVDFNDFLFKHELGQYKYKDHLFQTNDMENARFIFSPSKTKINSLLMNKYKVNHRNNIKK